MNQSKQRKHLTKEERFCIEKLLRQQQSYRDIAHTLDRSVSSIWEEVTRNGGRDEYQAVQAQQRAYLRQYRKKRSCLKVAMSPFLSRFVEEKIRLYWSPEAISAYVRRFHRHDYVSPKAIRKFVQKRCLESYLYRSRVRPKRKMYRTSGITDRLFVTDVVRVGYGHWEGDFIVSSKSSSVLLVVVERKSRETRIRCLPNRNNVLVNQNIVSLLSDRTVQSLTIDNDIAFNKHQELADMLMAPVYFTRPYCSTDKALVENTNLWIRQFVPKKSDFSNVTNNVLDQARDWLNQIPRQSLGWRTAEEVGEYYEGCLV